MNPQHIVYIGLVLVGLGVSISAIDPLKPLPDIFGNLPNDYFAVGFVVAENEYWKKELIAPNTYRETFYPKNDTEYDISSIPDYFAVDLENIPAVAVITSRCSADGFVNSGVFNFEGVIYDYCENVNGEWYLEVQ